MITYWVMYLSAAAMCLGYQGTRRAASGPIWFVVGLLFVLAIGLRFEVGCDWFAYL